MSWKLVIVNLCCNTEIPDFTFDEFSYRLTHFCDIIKVEKSYCLQIKYHMIVVLCVSLYNINKVGTVQVRFGNINCSCPVYAQVMIQTAVRRVIVHLTRLDREILYHTVHMACTLTCICSSEKVFHLIKSIKYRMHYKLKIISTCVHNYPMHILYA